LLAESSTTKTGQGESGMTATEPEISPFLLIDSAMLGGTEAYLPMQADARPDWLLPIYKETAATVSPLLIDMAAAEQAGQLDLMMKLFNAMHPQLHASLIETRLSHDALAQHLRHFIFVRLASGDEPTLRFADCAVLPSLAAVLTPAQWAAVVGPMTRWCVHQRHGVLTALALAEPGQELAPTPLTLTAQQDALLTELEAPDQLIGNLLRRRKGQTLPGDMAEQHRWASEAIAQWRAAGHSDNGVLLLLADAIFDTQGRLLGHSGLADILAHQNAAAINVDLKQAIERYSGQA
jgi:hypothetical protein